MLRWLEIWRSERRKLARRGYYARREAEAMRMQFGPDAEARCEAKLRGTTNARRQRFLRLVLKALNGV